MRALVVDDSKAARSLIGRMVREMGFEVVEAANGREALQRLAEGGPVDLALVDWNMPEMNGLDFVVAARADRRFIDVPLVMCTSETEMSKVVQALDAGASEYIMKPFNKDALRGKLELLGLLLAA